MIEVLYHVSKGLGMTSGVISKGGKILNKCVMCNFSSLRLPIHTFIYADVDKVIMNKRKEVAFFYYVKGNDFYLEAYVLRGWEVIV